MVSSLTILSFSFYQFFLFIKQEDLFFHFHSLTNMQWFTELSTTYFITDIFVINSEFVFNYILMDVIYLKFELIDFSVISNWQGVEFNPCIKNKTTNWQESEGGYKATSEIKSTYQQRNRRDRQTYREFILLEVNAVSDDKDV